MLEMLLTAEQNFLLWIQDNIRNDMLTPVFVFITTLGNAGIVWILMSVGMLFFPKTRKAGVACLISLLLSLIVDNVILKNLVARTRPYDVIPGLTSLVGAMKDYSFPSGHTGSSFAAAVVMLRMLPKRYGIPAVVLAVLIGLSRLYVGVHYPTDVLAGAMIGSGIAVMVSMFAEKINIGDRNAVSE